jgi:hypothetical protein
MSREHIENEKNKREKDLKKRLRKMKSFLILICLFLGVAIWQFISATNAKDRAEESERIAIEEKEKSELRKDSLLEKHLQFCSLKSKDFVLSNKYDSAAIALEDVIKYIDGKENKEIKDSILREIEYLLNKNLRYQSYSAFIAQGSYYEKTDDYKNAKIEYLKALKMEFDNEQAKSALINLEHKIDNKITYYKRQIELFPDVNYTKDCKNILNAMIYAKSITLESVETQ